MVKAMGNVWRHETFDGKTIWIFECFIKAKMNSLSNILSQYLVEVLPAHWLIDEVVHTGLERLSLIDCFVVGWAAADARLFYLGLIDEFPNDSCDFRAIQICHTVVEKD